MVRRLFTILSGVSLVVCLCITSAWLHSSDDGLHLRGGSRDEVRLSVGRGRWEFNCIYAYGPLILEEDFSHPATVNPATTRRLPYSQSRLMGFSWSSGQERRHVEGELRHPRPASFWTVAGPLWPLVLVTAVGSARFLAVARRWQVRRRRSLDGLCPACGYDLRATVGPCPECGPRVD